jgi:hypothetical protein
LSTQQGLQLFNRIFTNNSTKTFSAVLTATKAGVLANAEGMQLFDRMFSFNPNRTFTALLAAYHGGELTKPQGLILFDRMFQASRTNTYSAVLNAVKTGTLSQAGGETLFNRMFQADPHFTATKTIIVKKGAQWNATAANIAEKGMTGSTSTVHVSSLLTLDSVLNNSLLSYSKADAGLVYGRIANATERSGNLLSLIYARLWNIEVYTERSQAYSGNISAALSGASGITVHSEFRYGSLATFAKGGVTNEASIFGEAGWEAAVPLPDGKTIPVTVKAQPNDNALLEKVLSELRIANAQRGHIAVETIKKNEETKAQIEAQTRAIKRQEVAA